MSPRGLVRNVPKLATVEVAIGTDSDEWARVGAGGSVEPGESRSWRWIAAATLLEGELPASEASVAAFQRGGAQALRHRRVGRAPIAGRRGDAAAGVGVDSAEIQRRVWTRFGPTLVAEHWRVKTG